MTDHQNIYSVIVTVFNKEDYISDTIKSVLEQSYSNFELLIINDGSTDNSLEQINLFKDPRITVYSQNNKGVSASRNRGIEESNHEYIAFLDGDDLWFPDYLETIDKVVNLFPNQNVFASAIAHKYKKEIIPADYSFKLNNDIAVLDFFENSLKQPILSGSSIVLKKSILKITGSFKEQYGSSEDTDMWINIGLHYPIVFIKSVKVLYRYDDFSLSNSDFNAENKPRYETYYEEEASDPNVKKYIDQNRYSLALMSKLYGNKGLYRFYSSKLDRNNLSLKKRILLNCPRWILKFLLSLKALKGRKLYYRPLNLRNSL